MRNFDNLRQAVECPKSWNSMDYVCLKATFLHLNHYLQIYLTLLWTDLLCGKWHDEYSKFSPEHLKVSKLGFWWDPLIQSYKSMSLKSKEEWCHDHEEWRKNLKRNWLAISNLTWGISQILTQALESLKNFVFNVLLLRKLYIVRAKKVQRSYLSWN